MHNSFLLKVACFLAGCCLAVALLAVAFNWRQSTRARKRAADLPITVRQAQPLIAAISQYRREHGAPPPALVRLIPKYIAKLPTAGPAAEKGWDYQPSARRVPGAWSLSIRVRDEYSPNVMGFGDTFVYHSNGKYVGADYGGGLMRFGKWGYYVE